MVLSEQMWGDIFLHSCFAFYWWLPVFHIPVGHLYAFFGKDSVQGLYPFLSWIICFYAIEFYEFLIHSKCSFEWINKMWPTHTIEYYSAVKRNEALIHATAEINLENIMLHERSQIQNMTYCMISFVWNAQKRQFYRDRKQIRGCLGPGTMREMRSDARRYKVTF